MNESALYALVAAVAALCLSWAWRWARSRWRMLEMGATGEHYYALVDQSPNGVLVADAASYRIVAANPACLHSLGYTLEEIRALTILKVFGEEGAEAKSMLKKLRDPGRGPMHVRQRRKDGSEIEVEVTGHRIEFGGKRALAFTTHDVSLKRKIEAQLLEKQQHLDHLAHHDQLTGLPNRLFLAAHLPAAIDGGAGRGRHARGAVPRSRPLQAHQRLARPRDRRQAAEDRGTAGPRHGAHARLGRAHGRRRVHRGAARSEEPDQVNETAGRINEALNAPIVIDGRPLVTTVSIGVSLCPRDGTTIGELLRQSDTAMYQAKDRGRNNFQLFSPTMDRKLKERMAIEASLREALEAKQFDVHYQPVVDLETNRVVTLEALVRWKHPSHGFVSPARFIGIAEETGLIMPIGEFVLERVMNHAARWRDAGCELVPIAVNVSAVQLQRGNLPATIQALAKERGLKPSMLQIELTESAAFERDSRTGESSEDAIAKLRELGVRIAIDDFGTGYSSLSYLKRWRVDYLKIDRSFVRDLVTDMGDLAIVGAIIAMARHLHIEVVAEGIEGWQQLEKLRQLGCPYAQGFLFAKPAPAVQCDRLLNGAPLDLTGTDVFLDGFDATGT